MEGAAFLFAKMSELQTFPDRAPTVLEETVQRFGKTVTHDVVLSLLLAIGRGLEPAKPVNVRMSKSVEVIKRRAPKKRVIEKEEECEDEDAKNNVAYRMLHLITDMTNARRFDNLRESIRALKHAYLQVQNANVRAHLDTLFAQERGGGTYSNMRHAIEAVLAARDEFPDEFQTNLDKVKACKDEL